MDGVIIFAAMIMGFIGGLVLACWLQADLPNREQEAIEKGYARYNPKTGDWEWIDPTECGQK